MNAADVSSVSHQLEDGGTPCFSKAVSCQSPATCEQLAHSLHNDGYEMAVLSSGWTGHTIIAAHALHELSLDIHNGLCTLTRRTKNSSHTGNRTPMVLWSGGSISDGIRRLFNQMQSIGLQHVSPLPDGVGWIGHITYDAGRRIELPCCGFTGNLAAFQCFQDYYCFTGNDTWLLVTVEAQPHASQSRIDQLKFRLAAASGEESLPPGAIKLLQSPDRCGYLHAVRRAQQYIADGDIYQINVSGRWVGQAANPLTLWGAMYAASPARYSTYIRRGRQAICSTSPEMFLARCGEQLTTCPIKGTHPRKPADPHLDRTAREQLLKSPKERAELAMILDLLRNDLGRVCQIGSVQVLAERQMESLPSVWQTYATVGGVSDLNWGDIFCGMLPGGSITGVPKIRAMQIIDELEPYQRGVYCGNLGWLRGDVGCFNIAIRTAVWEDGHFQYHAGAGIVADSDAESEYDEICAKAQVVTCLQDVSADEIRRQG